MKLEVRQRQLLKKTVYDAVPYHQDFFPLTNVFILQNNFYHTIYYTEIFFLLK